jgi:hypothetical protein
LPCIAAPLRRRHGEVAGLVQQVAGKTQPRGIEQQRAVLDRDAGEDGRLDDLGAAHGEPDVGEKSDDPARQRLIHRGHLSAVDGFATAGHSAMSLADIRSVGETDAQGGLSAPMGAVPTNDNYLLKMMGTSAFA